MAKTKQPYRIEPSAPESTWWDRADIPSATARSKGHLIDKVSGAGKDTGRLTYVVNDDDFLSDDAVALQLQSALNCQIIENVTEDEDLFVICYVGWPTHTDMQIHSTIACEQWTTQVLTLPSHDHSGEVTAEPEADLDEIEFPSRVEANPAQVVPLYRDTTDLDSNGKPKKKFDYRLWTDSDLDDAFVQLLAKSEWVEGEGFE